MSESELTYPLGLGKYQDWEIDIYQTETGELTYYSVDMIFPRFNIYFDFDSLLSLKQLVDFLNSLDFSSENWVDMVLRVRDEGQIAFVFDGEERLFIKGLYMDTWFDETETRNLSMAIKDALIDAEN